MSNFNSIFHDVGNKVNPTNPNSNTYSGSLQELINLLKNHLKTSTYM